MIRKIETQEERDRKAKRNKIIVGVVLCVVLILSYFGYALTSRDSEETGSKAVSYAGLSFVKANDFWSTTVNGKQLFFSFSPTEILAENISTTAVLSLENYYNKPVYFVNANAYTNLIYNALDGIALRVQEACVDSVNCTNLQLPVKNCTDNLIIFTNPDARVKITKEDGCVFIEGEPQKATDFFIYRLVGIL